MGGRERMKLLTTAPLKELRNRGCKKTLPGRIELHFAEAQGEPETSIWREPRMKAVCHIEDPDELIFELVRVVAERPKALGGRENGAVITLRECVFDLTIHIGKVIEYRDLAHLGVLLGGNREPRDMGERISWTEQIRIESHPAPGVTNVPPCQIGHGMITKTPEQPGYTLEVSFGGRPQRFVGERAQESFLQRIRPVEGIWRTHGEKPDLTVLLLVAESDRRLGTNINVIHEFLSAHFCGSLGQHPLGRLISDFTAEFTAKALIRPLVPVYSLLQCLESQRVNF